jgi:hypothetical protein
MNRIQFLEETIKLSQQAYQMQRRVTAALVLIGIGLIVTGTVLTQFVVPDYWKWVLTLGGTFTASLSTTRAKDISSERDRISALQSLKQEIEQFSLLAAPNSQEYERLCERVERLFDKRLGL